MLSRLRSLKNRPHSRPRRRVGRFQSLERRRLLAADTLAITIENLADDGGLFQTPVWIAAHDGTFDVGSPGVSAADFRGLEPIAEIGDTSELSDRFALEDAGVDATVVAPEGFTGAPVFDPGEVVRFDLDVPDTNQQRYFSFASMIIPSNDAFIANLDPLAHEIYDETGEFVGTRTIVIYGRDVYDAGTEVNDPSGGAAFATAGGDASDENGVIRRHDGLDDFVGAGLPTGEPLRKAFGDNTPLARITIDRAGAVSGPIDTSGPLVALDGGDLNQRSEFHELSITYSDPSGIDLTSIDVDDLRVTAPLLDRLEILSVSHDGIEGTNPSEVTAIYRVAPDSGSFTAIDNGTYQVSIVGDQVGDSLGITAEAQVIGSFEVDAPVQIQVRYENLAADGGVSQTPVWIGAHNGGFEIARAGLSADGFGGLEALAEEGDVSELAARFAAEGFDAGGVIVAPEGFAGAPVIEPGESAIQTLDIADPGRDRFFSFASMVIPSNDAFIANLDPRGYELFDANGHFTGARTITIYGSEVWDAGTEVNDPSGGAAFSTEGGTSMDEWGVVRRHFGLQDFVGTGLPTGDDLERAFAAMTPIGRLTISLSDLPVSAIDLSGPMAQLDATDVVSADVDQIEVAVTYTDGSGIDPSSIDRNDLEVVSTTGRGLDVLDVRLQTGNAEGNEVITIYTLQARDGEAFSTGDNGLYFVSLRDSAIEDTLANAVEGQSLGSFEILTPVQLEVTVENLAVEGGLSQTPFWIGVHDGNFVTARLAQSASEYPGLEAIAEEGDVSGLRSRFATESIGNDAVVFAPDGFVGAPVFEPGEIASQTLDVFDTNANRFFSFASMLIPSNDAFLANLNPRQYELFSADGFFAGPLTITIFGDEVWDAGTEVNDPTGGAAFSTEGGAGVDENGLIRRHEGLDDFVGTGLPTGETLGSAFNASTPLARITIALAGQATVPDDDAGPTASVRVDDIDEAGTESHIVEVLYTDPSGVDITSIDTEDIAVTGPLNRPLDVTGVEIIGNPGDTSVIARYSVATPDGPFTARDNGDYRVILRQSQVGDTLGQSNVAASLGSFEVVTGVRVQITIESLTEAGGLFHTPLWVGFHDGSFEVARRGVPADAFGGLELIAEEGSPAELAQRFAAESTGTDAVLLGEAGFAGAPVIDPGETTTITLEIDASDAHRYFSFATMVIPSNDAFLANVDSTAHELFDDRGNFRGARQITLFGRDVYDAGTEQNRADGGAAFSTEGGEGVDENGLIRRHAGLDNFVGTGLPTGETLQTAFDADTPLAVITVSLVDPEPESCSGELAACSSRSVSLQNAGLSADVNRDGRVTPLDSLLVLNFVRRNGILDTIADEAQATGYALDVDGDARVNSVDALNVINEIRRRNARSGAGEAVSPTTDRGEIAVDGSPIRLVDEIRRTPQDILDEALAEFEASPE